MKSKIIYFFAPLPAFSKRTRLAKMVPLFLQHGYSLNLYGWERQVGELGELKWNDSRVCETAILKGGGYVSSLARLMYPIWMAAVFFKVLFLGRKKVLFCLGWETAFPAVMASLLTGSKVIFDDADRFSMIVNLPDPFDKAIRWLERWTSRRSFLHLIPGWARYDWYDNNMFVLRNSPSSADFSRAKSSGFLKDSESLKVYINGWVGDTRGAPIFLKALNMLSNYEDKIVFHIAGRVDSAEGELLVRHDSSIFYGEIPQFEALAIYASSDVVLTFYDPAIEINRQAESNKWGDCVFFGTPFIVNSEVATAKTFTSSGGAWEVEYSDVNGLVNLLVYLCRNRAALKAASKAMAAHIDNYPIFDTQISKIIRLIEYERAV